MTWPVTDVYSCFDARGKFETEYELALKERFLVFLVLRNVKLTINSFDQFTSVEFIEGRIFKNKNFLFSNFKPNFPRKHEEQEKSLKQFVSLLSAEWYCPVCLEVSDNTEAGNSVEQIPFCAFFKLFLGSRTPKKIKTSKKI